jgi:serine/threonine-protein kinase RsbW
VIQHAGPGDEYEVLARAQNGRCVIEVVNTGSGDGGLVVTPSAGPVPTTEEHGRGLKIIDAVVDNLRLTRNDGHGTTVHFEKTLDWVPGAPDQHLFSGDSAG